MTAGSMGTAGPASFVQPAAATTPAPKSAAARARRAKARRPPATLGLLPTGGPVGHVEALPGRVERLGLLAQPGGERLVLGEALLRGVVAHVLRDLHRAEVRPAHRAEVRALGGGRGQRLVVELARRVRIERKVELVLPAEVEARLAERVVAPLRARVPLGEVRRVRRDLVGD